MKRHQENWIIDDLKRGKMACIVGPRQVGKTWLTQSISKEFTDPVYLNYDAFDDRLIIQNREWLRSTTLLILDELHKMPDWKQYLKGIYDTKPNHLSIIVTGSARLDTFSQSGESLAGRILSHRLLPLSLSEANQTKTPCSLKHLIDQGGFPEPFLAKDDNIANRWRHQYITGLIRDDILDFERITELSALKTLVELLRRQVGSPLSYSSLSRDIGVAPNTIKKYINVLESLFIVFTVTPYSRNIARSLQKEPKLYFYDTGLVIGDIGAKFENMVAVSLLKHCLGLQDYKGQAYALHTIKTKERREIDFCLTHNDEPETLIEAKTSDTNIHKDLHRFSTQLNVPGIQVVLDPKHERETDTIQVLSANRFLKTLFL